MARMSASEGPTWRGTNVSAEGSGGTDGLLGRWGRMGRGQQKGRENSSPAVPARAPAPPRDRSWSEPETGVGPFPGTDSRCSARLRARITRFASVVARRVRCRFDLLLAVVHREEQPHAGELMIFVLRR